MIYSNIAEYEPGDSILARQTILDLHKEIERLIKGCIALEEEMDDLRKLEITITMENERLNNIINDIEKHLQNEISKGKSKDNVWLMGCYDEDREILDKLQELKGSDKE